MKLKSAKSIKNTNTNNSELFDIKSLNLSFSTMTSFEDCPRKLEFAKFYNINIEKRSLAPEGGNCLHSALGVYLKTKDTVKAIEYLVLNYPIDLCQMPTWSWSLEACYSALISLIGYFKVNTHLQLALINGAYAEEVPFIIKLNHNIPNFMPIAYRGFIDFVLYNEHTESFEVYELKNSKNKNNYIQESYKFSAQGLPYSLILQALLDMDFSNISVTYLLSKVHILEPEVQAVEFNKTIQDTQEWARDIYMKILMIKNYHDAQWFPRKSGGCTSYGTGCKFFDICGGRDKAKIKLLLKAFHAENSKINEDFFTKKAETAEFNPIELTLDLK